mgnify:CR=1 FL=1
MSRRLSLVADAIPGESPLRSAQPVVVPERVDERLVGSVLN